MAREPPYACCVVVWRDGPDGREFLVLHRLAPGGPDYEGEWAWTPPSGARLPDEEPDAAARRELHEETGLQLEILPTGDAGTTDDVALYTAQASPADAIVLDAEHDRFEWLSLEEALRRCLPLAVAEGLERAAAWLTATAGEARMPFHNRHESATHARENPR